MNILICGDSWGTGEHYKDQRPNPNTFGTDYFLNKLGYTTKNISIGGGANIAAYEELEKENLQNYDYIFLFYTNPLRDLWTAGNQEFFIPISENDTSTKQRLDKIFGPFKEKTLKYSEYQQMYENCVINFYTCLEKLKTKIHLIGGHNKVEDQFLKSEYIINFIPSVREFLYPDFTDDKLVWPFWYLTDYLNKFDEEAIEKIVISKNKWFLFPEIHKKYFSECPYHLDRFGHEVLANHIHKYITSR